MKSLVSLLLVFFLPPALNAQHPVPIRNLWTRPQVHVLFGGYKVSFAIRDINKALALMKYIPDTTYGTKCLLDTSKNYSYELYPGTHTQYRYEMEPLLQNGVGVFLLTRGLAEVENGRHKKLKTIIADIATSETGELSTFASFYDPDTHQMIFSGRIDVDLIGRDPGIDD